MIKTPRKDRVLLKRVPMAKRDVLDNNTQENDPHIFEVVSSGPDLGEEFTAGDLIIKHEGTGITFYDNGMEYVVVREDDIFLILEDK